MSTTIEPIPEGETAEARPPALAPRRRPQLRLRTLLLATAAVAAWFQVWQTERHVERLRASIATGAPLMHDLIVEDPTLIAAVKRPVTWYDQNEWDLYLPPGRRYAVRLATREVDEEGFPPVSESLALDPGRHGLALEANREDERWRIVVEHHSGTELVVDEPAEWTDGRGSSGGGTFTDSRTAEPAEPLVLFRRRFTVSDANGSWTTPEGPCNGILIWIEPLEASTEARVNAPAPAEG